MFFYQNPFCPTKNAQFTSYYVRLNEEVVGPQKKVGIPYCYLKNKKSLKAPVMYLLAA